MPHISADGMNDHDDTDYSSWEIQHAQFEHRESASGGDSARSTFTGGVDVLDDRGGLDANEVAELVGMFYTARVTSDDHETESVNAEGVAEFRGVVGIDVDSISDLLQEQDAGSGTLLESDDSSDGQLEIRSNSKDEVLTHFLTATANPFSSTGNNYGGGGGYIDQSERLNFRELYGRGPVIDSADEISVVTRLIKNNVQTTVEATLRLTLIWDIATVDEAGRRFSVPGMN